MKTLIQIAIVALLFTACSSNSLDQKKKELEKLKTTLKETQDKISKLELDIAKLDTSKKLEELLEIKKGL